MPIDPVCRMCVMPENAAAKVAYIGREYYFCSRECHLHFTANPQYYVSARERDGGSTTEARTMSAAGERGALGVREPMALVGPRIAGSGRGVA